MRGNEKLAMALAMMPHYGGKLGDAHRLAGAQVDAGAQLPAHVGDHRLAAVRPALLRPACDPHHGRSLELGDLARRPVDLDPLAAPIQRPDRMKIICMTS